MNANDATSQAKKPQWMVWVGRFLSALIVFALGMSAFMKFKGGPELDEGMSHLGIPMTLVTTLGVIEAVCVILYAIPVTSVIGAILLTGYLGGAIFAHLRVGDAVMAQIILGLLTWFGLFLRDPRLRSLIPLRTVDD